MTRCELVKALRHVYAYYDMYNSQISEECFIPMQLHNIATIMWVKQYPEDQYSKLIREQINYLWTTGMLIFD